MHNVTDGLLLVPAWLAGPTTGIVATLAILAHELVQETAEFFVLKEAGYSTREALRNNFIVSSTILAGVVAALLLSSVEGAESALIAFSAGGFLYIILRDLIPNSVKSVRENGKAGAHVAAALLGLAIMAGISLAAPHSHEDHGELDPDDHAETVAIDLE
jgi:zinc transporter ZupT